MPDQESPAKKGEVRLPRYRRTYPRIWKAMRGLSQGEKNITLYLCSGDQTNRCGYFDFSPGKASEDLEMSPEEFAAGFSLVCERFGWQFDEANRVVFIPSWWHWNPPEGPKQLIGCLKDLFEVARSPLFPVFAANLQTLPVDLHAAFQNCLAKMQLIPMGKGIPKGIAEGMCKGSPFQEQEQEQEQEKTHPLPLPSEGDGAGDFLKWFEAYPAKRRKDRLKAEREWQRLKGRGRLKPLAEMLMVLAAQARSAEWEREEGRFIPLPHKYLRLGRFEDHSVTNRKAPPPVTCFKCRGTGFRRALKGEIEDGQEGTVRCECSYGQEVRAP